jgi:hypothetical protein
MVLPIDRSDTIETPGATRFGLLRPSCVGPWLENPMTMSSLRSSVSCPYIAPTVTTKGSSPGLLTVPGKGPRLPAETTTRMPDCHTCSTA